ncbi:tryptophan-rich sensory protein [Rubrivirga marina]|uniref:Tryptophan-rich sensory protein n=1 Tax=Rubrivirga marina TaxID=1196024 RepID=A0A271IWV3_9BACT|nr:tryptophan-rich sensory protein [Rubrivirga marina]PAP75693.1 hypothetical protein BSZ37_04200 [Rubrivirga marina]
MHGAARQLAVVLAALANVGLNALAGAGVLFGTPTGAVSDAHPTPITPAGWAFSIWSVIFVGVLAFAAWQALPARRGPRYDGLGAPFVAANLLNGLWQIPWLAERFGLAALVIVGILASLVWLYVRLDRMGLRGAERWALGVPAALFLAWITVAAPLNVTVWLRDLGWTPAGTFWPIALVLTVAAIAGAWLARTGDAAAALVVLWAFGAIAAAHPDRATLLIGLGVGALVVITTAVRGARRYGPFPTAHAAPA